MIRIGIINYLPDDPQLRAKRKQFMEATTSELKSVVPADVKVYVASQNYKPDDFNPDIEYINFEGGVGISRARNALLEQFYNSDDDFMIYTDDDNSVCDRYNIKELFAALHHHPEWFSHVDCFGGIEGRFTPFTKKNSTMQLDKYFVFTSMPYTSSGEFRVLRNLKKYYGKEFYYDIQAAIDVCEDQHFRLVYLTQINSFECRNVILRNRGMVGDVSVLGFDNKLEQEEKYKQAVINLYERLGVPKTKNGKWDLAQYRNKIKRLSIAISDGIEYGVTPEKGIVHSLI